MDTQSLKAFLAVAGHRSFSAAGEDLHLTQSAVSKRIQMLEQQIGVTLFDRHNRTISLTEAGHNLLPRARAILDLVTDTELHLVNMEGEVSGSLSLATSHHIGLHRLPPVLREFVQRYPSALLNLEFMGSERAYQAITLRQVELALTTLEESDAEDVAHIPLWQDTMVCVCAPDHRLVQLEHVTLEDLASTPAILPQPDTITYRLVDEAFRERGLTLNAPMPTNYLETIKMMVSVGMGWSLLPQNMVDSQLHTLVWPGTSPIRHLGLIHLKHRTLSNAARAMIELLNDH
ncbi:LysR family transcriptional regulator [Thalassolituus sp.]|jgi:DNA-binding transcriptional LysR family regulator|uniref:LysR family transcriptional regulator n=1 Tax=Thalassolituus sp. TaxID=2030822 RepID=UPI001B764E77|nr:LysR family transcriptional regulator [Thalassolituus sp.]MBQ0779308.1 LysR family transcriptional regulator [Thalassolituus oleivorans]